MTNLLENLTNYSENELSMRVFNDEGLYNIRNHRILVEILNEYFKYTSEQMQVLQDDLRDDKGEN